MKVNLKEKRQPKLNNLKAIRDRGVLIDVKFKEKV